MKLLQKEKKNFVRIIVGMAQTGMSGIKKPIKSLNIENATVEEVFKLIIKIIEKLK